MGRIQQADREFSAHKDKLRQLFESGALTIDNMQSFEYHAHHWFKWGAECKKAGLFEDEKQQDDVGEMDLIELLSSE
ncbi:hypothetical protein [Salibacterium lacus]|uniref:Uncharacterized protein n=1 Tax=Salibacterium lacus TaxID=1898109 RepID=A0ABW5SXX2_9BACI